MTHHRALGGNYHRNIVGIADTITYLSSTPEAAKKIIDRHDIDYAIVCLNADTYASYADGYPESITAMLVNKNPPDFAKLVRDDLEDGAFLIYRFKN